MNIYDIAEKSGVSIATISRVLNGGKNVSPKTYEKVMSIIKEEGYTPNVFARGLGLDSMQTVGMLVTDVADPCFAEMVSILTLELRKLGFDIILGCTGIKLEDKKREVKMLQEKRVDAIFLVGSAVQELEDNRHLINAAKKTPIINVNGYINAPGIINIISNQLDGAYNATKRLFEEGYKNPLYVYNHYTYSGKEKITGFTKALSENGISPSKNSVVMLTAPLKNMIHELDLFLDQNPDFDSFVASEDLLAVACIKALQNKKRRCPVIGFNNSLLTLISTPTITSIDIMINTLCTMAVRLFQDLCEGKEISGRVVLDCRLVERETFPIK